MAYATAVVARAVRAALDRRARVGRLRRRHLLGRHAVHRLPERVRRHRDDPARACPAFLARGRASARSRSRSPCVSLLISFGHDFPLYGLLYDHLPLFNKFRIPVMILAAVPARGGARRSRGGGARVLERADGEAGRRARDASIAASSAWQSRSAVAARRRRARAGSVARGLRRERDRSSAAQPGYTARARRTLAYRSSSATSGAPALLGLAALGAAWLVLRGTLSRALATLGVLVLLVIELWPVSGQRHAAGDRRCRRTQRSSTGATTSSTSSRRRGRRERSASCRSTERVPEQSLRRLRHRVVGGYHAAKPRLFQDFLERRALDEPAAWLRLLNVRYVVSPQPLDPPPAVPARGRARGSVGRLRVPARLPRATLVGQLPRRDAGDTAILDSIATGTSDSERSSRSSSRTRGSRWDRSRARRRRS